MELHPGPRVDKVRFSGAIGMISAAGVLIGYLVEVPPVRWFFLPAAVLGIGFALFLRWRDR